MTILHIDPIDVARFEEVLSQTPGREVPVRCAWCGAELPAKIIHTTIPDAVSHGMCDRCLNTAVDVR